MVTEQTTEQRICERFGMRSYFDTKIGSRKSKDDEAAELQNVEAAEREAILAATEMAADALPIRDADEVGVDVRDDAGNPLLSAKLILVLEKQHSC